MTTITASLGTTSSATRATITACAYRTEEGTSRARRYLSNVSRRKYQDLFTGTERFSVITRICLERAVGHALLGRKGPTSTLRDAVRQATRELRREGLDDAAILAVLGAIVENAGRGCGADKASLLSGLPLWSSVQMRVLASANDALAREAS